MIQPLELLEIIGTIVILIALGFTLKKIGVAKKEHSGIINNIIVYLTLPALIFTSITRAQLSFELIKIPVTAIITMLLVLIAAFFIAKKLKFEAKLLGSFLLVSSIGNTGYLGYPMASQIAGNQGLTKAIFYDIFGTVLVIFTVGLFIAEIYGGKTAKINKVKEIMTFPPLIALLVAFLLKPLTLPPVIISSFSTLGAVTIPLIMISIGLSLEFAKVRNYLTPFLIAFFLKLIISPLIALGISALLKLSPQAVLITVMEGAMPPAMLSLVFGLKYELDNIFIASVIFGLTVASALTVPFILLVFF